MTNAPVTTDHDPRELDKELFTFLARVRNDPMKLSTAQQQDCDDILNRLGHRMSQPQPSYPNPTPPDLMPPPNPSGTRNVEFPVFDSDTMMATGGDPPFVYTGHPTDNGATPTAPTSTVEHMMANTDAVLIPRFDVIPNRVMIALEVLKLKLGRPSDLASAAELVVEEYLNATKKGS